MTRRVQSIFLPGGGGKHFGMQYLQCNAMQVLVLRMKMLNKSNAGAEGAVNTPLSLFVRHWSRLPGLGIL